jgi:hypothetical protein
MRDTSRLNPTPPLPHFNLSRAGITEMREALAEKEDAEGLKARMRNKV